MSLKRALQEKLTRYDEIFSDIKEVCAIYVVNIENGKYVKKIFKYETKEHQYNTLLQKGFVLFTDPTIEQAVLETTEYNMALRKIDEKMCFVLISEKSLTFGKIIVLIKQHVFSKGKE